MIELTTVTGLDRTLMASRIVDVLELPAKENTLTQITLHTGETFVVVNDYEEVMSLYWEKMKKPASLADDTSKLW
jgi:uncharacterized protein YlzI (FlbEa/FlbD family)